LARTDAAINSGEAKNKINKIFKNQPDHSSKIRHSGITCHDLRKPASALAASGAIEKVGAI
jgi:hypothetical protein